jgi:amino acid adenylation domain-containing protein/non-ribosomal peptide synthase protein (TIGR01720 family)
MTVSPPAQDTSALEASFPLSPSQQGMLYHTLLEPEAGVFLEQMVGWLPEPVNADVFLAAWRSAIERHAVLRTGFRFGAEGGGQQEVHRSVPLEARVEDWSGLPAEAQEARFAAFLAADRSRGFDLERPPLHRVALFRLGPADFRMVFTFHHAILDSRGLTLLYQEVFGSYEAAISGQATPSPPAPARDFRRYLEWLDKLDLAAAEAHWRGVLSGVVAPTPLPMERGLSDTGGETARQGHRTAWLDAPSSAALEAAAKAHGVTMTTVIQGAWAVLLGRYSGETSVVFGVARACRKSSIPEVEDMVAHLVNTLPLRARLAPDAPFFPWLRELREQWTAMRGFEHTPPARVQAWSGVAAGLPLFETVVNYDTTHYQNQQQTPSALGRARRFEMFEVTSYPLMLAAYGGERLCLKIEYDRRRFDDAAIERVLSHLVTLLESAAAEPLRPLGELPILSAAERHLLLEGWNPSPVAPEASSTLPDLFEAVAARWPTRIACECEGEQLTYAELNAAANQVAHRLRAMGVGPDVLVALCAERSLALVIGLLGILKAGGAYVPIDLSTPADRVAFILTDSAAPVMLTQRHLMDRLPAGRWTPLVIEDAAADSAAGNPRRSVRPEHLAYVIYTSGSTGQPKGVLVTHANVARLFQQTDAWFGFGPEDVWTLFHSAAFDFSVWEIWGALLFGGRLVVVPYLVSRSPEAFVELVASRGVTVLNQTPSAFRQFIQADAALGAPALALRWVIFGGEALDLASLTPWYERHGDSAPRLVNMYGITETTVHVTYRPLSRADVARGSVIGVPIPDLQVYVLDEKRGPAPIGVPGELYVGGAGLARGYLNRPELTAERFVPHPFRPGERLYRTGDRARFLAERDLEYLGRLDFQVKVRGFRIELGEIESALASHPAVREAVVLCREDRPGEKRLVAYTTDRQGTTVSAQELRVHLQAGLPEYMVPAAFVRLEAFPITGNGKLDRSALPAPVALQERDAAGYVAPRTPTEARLAEIWAGVLRVDRVGAHDNFYGLGGDSILSIQIAAKARQAGLNVTVGAVLKHPTIADLAASLDRGKALASIDDSALEGTAPLTPIQQWFFQLAPAEPQHWNQAFLFETSETLDTVAFRGAVAELLRHHPALRLRFTRDGTGWRQELDPPASLSPVWIEDLSSVPDAELSHAIGAVAARAAASLDLSRGPLLRAVDLPLGGARGGRVLLVIHHLAVDGVSWRILLEDFETAYRQLRAGSPPRLPAATTSWTRWAQGLEAAAASGMFAEESAYWRAAAADPLVPLPVDLARDAENTEGRAGIVTASLDAAETAALLQRVPAAYNTQINDILLTALADALAPWAGQGELLVDLEGHGREDVVAGADVTRTVGWFTSMFPIRLPLGGAGDPAGRIKAIKERLRAVPRRGIGYGVLRYLSGSPALSPPRRADLVFNYLGQFDQLVADSSLLRFAAEDAGPWRSPRGARSHLLEVNALVRGGRLQFLWTHGRGIHEESTVRRLADATISRLRDLVRHCLSPDAFGRSPSDYPLVSLDQAAVDRLSGSDRDVEAILPLAPMQSLFLATSGGGTDVGFEQWRYELSGPLDPSAFRQAWEHVVERHAILRASFPVEGLAQPVQVIRRRVALPLTALDWRGLDSAEQNARLEALLSEDRAHGFRVAEAPLFRLMLIRTAEQGWTLVWSHHHLLLDRWSFPIVLREVGLAYDAIRASRRPELPAPQAWERYLAWQRERPAGADETFWKAKLEGAPPAALPRLTGAGGASGQRFLALGAEETARITAGARERNVSLNALVSLAWGLWIARATGRTDVVFGVTVAGRPEELPGITELVGMCINNVPARLRFDPEEPVSAVLERLAGDQRDITPHEGAPLQDVQRWCGLAWHQRPFDSLLVFQHHGAEEQTSEWLGRSIAIRMAPVETHTNFPLALVVSGGPSLKLQLAYLGRHAGPAAAEKILLQLRDLLTTLPGILDQPVRRALELLPPIEAASPARERPAAPPRSNTEWVVARIWAELMGRDSVSREDDFFDLGGHSLVATQILSRVRDAFRMELPISLIFEHPVVGDFAAALKAREAAPDQVERIATIVRKVEEMGEDQLLAAGIRG